MTRLTRSIASCLTVLSMLFLQTAIAQNVLDPTDPVIEYNPLSPPAITTSYFNPIMKWVRTKGIAGNAVQNRSNNSGWNSDSYKAYLYDAAPEYGSLGLA